MQSIDSQLDQIESRHQEINRELKGDKTLFLAESQKAKKEKSLQEATAMLRKAEDAVTSVRIKLETNDATLYSGTIRNPKELEDLQSEHRSLKRRLETLEDEQLEAMFTVEGAEDALAAAGKALNEAKSQFATKSALLVGEQNQSNKKSDSLNKERSAIASSITPDNAAVYDKLRQKKNGLAVALVEDDSCSACGSIVRPAEQQSARSPQSMGFCSTCGRILFLK